ncbi:hypothetical protein OG21DRAFT_1521809 [Imleria badia]|nr:hypothetical protein OG21DRAFT_1521809 [Imleria badia]
MVPVGTVYFPRILKEQVQGLVPGDAAAPKSPSSIASTPSYRWEDSLIRTPPRSCEFQCGLGQCRWVLEHPLEHKFPMDLPLVQRVMPNFVQRGLTQRVFNARADAPEGRLGGWQQKEADFANELNRLAIWKGPGVLYRPSQPVYGTWTGAAQNHLRPTHLLHQTHGAKSSGWFVEWRLR